MGRGILCDKCEAFMPDRGYPRGTFTYWRNDGTGTSEQVELMFCNDCADVEAERHGLIGVADLDPFATPVAADVFEAAD